MTKVLFICTGNTCRSPMAEALLKSKNSRNIEVKSAGVFASDGSPASNHTKQVLFEKGIACNHASSMLTDGLVEWADIILAMTESHKYAVLDRFAKARGKVFTLAEFAGKGEYDISDPFGGNVEIYRETLAQLEEMVDAVYKKIEN